MQILRHLCALAFIIFASTISCAVDVKLLSFNSNVRSITFLLLVWVVAQLVEWLLPIAEVRGLVPVIGKIYIELTCLLSTVSKRQK